MKYSDYVYEITTEEIYDRLVSCGLIAEKIPSFLKSDDFLEYTKTIQVPISSVKGKDYVRYSSMRNINIPRQMAIPEPFAYANLCKCLSENWERLKVYFKFRTRNQNFKVSRIHLRKMENTFALFEMNYKNFSKDKSPEQDIIIKSKYIVNADISNFFPSIYSHSITWALKGKIFAKKNKDQTLWFNQLDFYIRNQKYGETNGVLIGPHASNLISEIIMARVDYELVNKGYKYIRHIDDYTCYVETYEKGEKFLVDLSEELRKYELKLNDKKSEIIPLPQASVKNWVNKLNNYIFLNSYENNGEKTLRLKELKAFLDFVIELVLKEKNDTSILNYAIKILANKKLSQNAKEYFIKQMHHLVILYPYLIHLFDEYVFEPHEISKETIKDIAIDIYNYGIEKKFYEATSYAIFWALKYNFVLLEITDLIDSAEKSDDAIFLLLSYLYDKRNENNSNLIEYRKIARKLKSDFDRYWLFIYEVLSWTELAGEYRIMKQNSNVSFVKDEYK
jgi:hypothetical protein